MIPQFVPYWDDMESRAVNDIMASDYLNEHKMTRKFESEFARFVGAKHCVAVTSGTVALYCATNAFAGKVRIPAHDGIFAFNALIWNGAVPAVADVDEHGLLDVDRQPAVVVHANGRISGITTQVEDCAQATTHHTLGSVSTYSFASTKHITTAGQGGAVCCDDEDTFAALCRIKDHGRDDRYGGMPPADNFERWGTNFKFTEIQAAFGLAQLRKMPARMKRFGEMIRIYRECISHPDISFPDVEPKWYVDVMVPDPDLLVNKLKKRNISCRRFPKPLNMQPVADGYSDGEGGVDGCPNAEARYKHGLYLPSSTNLDDETIKHVADEINDAVR